MPGHFLVDIASEQACGEARVFGFFYRQFRRGADRQLVELARAGVIVQTGNGFQRHAHRIDVVEAFATACHRAHDLVQIDRLLATVAFGHAHRSRRVRRRQREVAIAGCSAGVAHRHGNIARCRRIRRGVFTEQGLHVRVARGGCRCRHIGFGSGRSGWDRCGKNFGSRHVLILWFGCTWRRSRARTP